MWQRGPMTSDSQLRRWVRPFNRCVLGWAAITLIVTACSSGGSRTAPPADALLGFPEASPPVADAFVKQDAERHDGTITDAGPGAWPDAAMSMGDAGVPPDVYYPPNLETARALMLSTQLILMCLSEIFGYDTSYGSMRWEELHSLNDPGDGLDYTRSRRALECEKGSRACGDVLACMHLEPVDSCRDDARCLSGNRQAACIGIPFGYVDECQEGECVAGESARFASCALGDCDGSHGRFRCSSDRRHLDECWQNKWFLFGSYWQQCPRRRCSQRPGSNAVGCIRVVGDQCYDGDLASANPQDWQADCRGSGPACDSATHIARCVDHETVEGCASGHLSRVRCKDWIADSYCDPNGPGDEGAYCVDPYPGEACDKYDYAPTCDGDDLIYCLDTKTDRVNCRDLDARCAAVPTPGGGSLVRCVR